MATALVKPVGQASNLIFPLSADQERTYQRYVLEGRLDQLYRSFFYLSDNETARGAFARRVSYGFGMGAMIGGLFSFCAARIFTESNPTSDDDKRTLKITGVGAGLGASIGGYLNGTQAWSEIASSPEYLAWRKNAIETKAYPLFQKFLQDSDSLSQFLCDIDQDLIRNPVKAPNGRVYEKSAIEAWLSQKAIEYPPERLAAMSTGNRQEALLSFCPRRSCHLTQDMLVPDFDYHRRVALALKPLFEQQLNEQFKQGLLNYQIAFLKDRESLIREIIKDVALKFSSGQISEDSFLAACRECKAHYGIPQ